MDPQYIALLAGLVGALVGAGASVMTVLIQGHYQHKSAMTQQALVLALEDWKCRLEIIKAQGGEMLPLAVFINYHARLIAIAGKRSVTPEDIRSLHDQQERLIDAIKTNAQALAKKAGAA